MYAEKELGLLRSNHKITVLKAAPFIPPASKGNASVLKLNNPIFYLRKRQKFDKIMDNTKLQ